MYYLMAANLSSKVPILDLQVQAYQDPKGHLTKAIDISIFKVTLNCILNGLAKYKVSHTFIWELIL